MPRNSNPSFDTCWQLLSLVERELCRLGELTCTTKVFRSQVYALGRIGFSQWAWWVRMAMCGWVETGIHLDPLQLGVGLVSFSTGMSF